jgi:hypothetical protein
MGLRALDLLPDLFFEWSSEAMGVCSGEALTELWTYGRQQASPGPRSSKEQARLPHLLCPHTELSRQGRMDR